MKRNASAHWEGDVKQGKGTISAESGALTGQPYGFNTRFENGAGSNPEELLGAAHAACFSMALSMILGEAGFTPDSIDTRAEVSIEEQDGGFAITAIHLDTSAKVPGASKEVFDKCANDAKDGCPVSKLFDVGITLVAKLEG